MLAVVAGKSFAGLTVGYVRDAAQVKIQERERWGKRLRDVKCRGQHIFSLPLR